MPTDIEQRPSWDTIWMEMAHSISRRSYDPKLKVGAIIVTADNTSVLALGYNGNYAGGPNERDSTARGESGFIHAEVNALLKMDYHDHKRKVMYVTHSPCIMCAKAIINAGIDEVVYARRYDYENSVSLLTSAGVAVRYCGE
ncbi:MAG: deoxycytidylate deaminase [Opitutae bacterium]|nr:deoxycytidylate deaminase [Opitutae bacterium]